MTNTASPQTAQLFRMVTDDHICPFGLKAKNLLERKGFKVEDNLLETREQADAFIGKHDIETTPQVFISGERIGGYEAVRKYFGMDTAKDDETTYQPVIVVFSLAALMALAISWAAFGSLTTVRAIEWFIAISMCVLAILKLRDLESFSNMFLGYDILARRVVRYAYVYPFAEAGAGVLMLAGALTWLSAPVALFVGSIGAVSVFKAVYIDKRDLKCACVGGNSNVPLGFISLTENIMMIGMGVWMLSK